MTIKIGFLTSSNGEKMQAIQAAIKNGCFDARIVFVGIDKKCPAMAWSAKNKIRTFLVNYEKIIKKCDDIRIATIPKGCDIYEILEKQKIQKNGTHINWRLLKSKIMAESELLSKIGGTNFDFLILDDFNRLLTPYFIDTINKDGDTPRIINVSKALLPFFPGRSKYKQTWEYGCTIAGCTTHFIDYGINTGPIILQKAFDITGKKIQEVEKKGFRAEKKILIESIKLCVKLGFNLKKLEQWKRGEINI